MAFVFVLLELVRPNLNRLIEIDWPDKYTNIPPLILFTFVPCSTDSELVKAGT